MSDQNPAREFWLPLTTLIVNSDKERPGGTHVIEYSAYEALRVRLDELLKNEAIIKQKFKADCELNEETAKTWLGVLNENTFLRAQLGEAVGLLREWRKTFSDMSPTSVMLDAFLEKLGEKFGTSN